MRRQVLGERLDSVPCHLHRRFVALHSLTAEKAYALKTDQSEAVYRLYNKWTNEHLYTTGKAEYDKLVKKG